jgi:hypothetical protein
LPLQELRIFEDSDSHLSHRCNRIPDSPEAAKEVNKEADEESSKAELLRDKASSSREESELPSQEQSQSEGKSNKLQSKPRRGKSR